MQCAACLVAARVLAAGVPVVCVKEERREHALELEGQCAREVRMVGDILRHGLALGHGLRDGPARQLHEHAVGVCVDDCGAWESWGRASSSSSSAPSSVSQALLLDEAACSAREVVAEAQARLGERLAAQVRCVGPREAVARVREQLQCHLPRVEHLDQTRVVRSSRGDVGVVVEGGGCRHRRLAQLLDALLDDAAFGDERLQ